MRNQGSYEEYLEHLQGTFDARLKSGNECLFTTDASELYEAFLTAIPEGDRQTHNCHACRDFVRKFGGLVTIDEQGRTNPLLWDPEMAPSYLRSSVEDLARRVRRARVTGVFLCSDKRWGQPVTGAWRHLAIVPPKSLLHQNPVKNAHQTMAEKREDYLQVTRALAEFSTAALQQAVTILESEQLYRSEKLLGAVQWLRNLRLRRDAAHGPARANLVWRAVAQAPAGFCHPRSGMAGTLLEDIAAGLTFDAVRERFAAKMHPLRYQRPQAAPAAGNIAQAEKLVEQLVLKAALQRRFARLEEVQKLWAPTPRVEEVGSGVFGHLKPKSARPEVAPLRMPATTMTWEKFQRTVLPTARRMEFYVPVGPSSFMALVTAVDPEAPPLLQWDLPEARNPVSWYFWNGGSRPEQWLLTGGAFHPVAAVAFFPPMWGGTGKFTHMGKGVTFFLEGMRETRNSGLGLFPETLRSELREVRATLEAYSRQGELAGMAEGSACGIGFSAGNSWNSRVRVHSDTGTTEYSLDRWD